MKIRFGIVMVVWLGLVYGLGLIPLQAEDLEIQSIDPAGQLVFSTPNDGTNYSFRVEWAPAPSGPWSSFAMQSPSWLDVIQVTPGCPVTNAVPMCYRVVATLGDYLVVDLSGGTDAVSYAVTYYRTLADVPGGANSDAYKTTNLLMRLIPKGVFTMGSLTNDLGRGIDETQHQVTVTNDFYMGVFAVTQKQWERVMGTWPSYFNNATYRESRPVERVSYYQIRENPNNTDDPAVDWPTNSNVNADSFMGRLRARTGKAFDLPTESQWEYAGRAGTDTALNSGYNLTNAGNDAHMSEVGRYVDNGGSSFGQSVDTSGATAKAGSYRPNAWGLYDIHGNVWEWCLDWYPGWEGLLRVYRGGGWSGPAFTCRVAYRNGSGPDLADYGVGFRVALPPGQ